jgi:hypothetical protein
VLLLQLTVLCSHVSASESILVQITVTARLHILSSFDVLSIVHPRSYTCMRTHSSMARVSRCWCNLLKLQIRANSVYLRACVPCAASQHWLCNTHARLLRVIMCILGNRSQFGGAIGAYSTFDIQNCSYISNSATVYGKQCFFYQLGVLSHAHAVIDTYQLVHCIVAFAS